MSGSADSPAPAPKLTRLVLKIPELTRRRLKACAAELGISVAVYVVRLSRADGVDVPEMAVAVKCS